MHTQNMLTYLAANFNYICYFRNADVFDNFKDGDEFFCFALESSKSVSAMFNLYRASQLIFPGEIILEQAKNYSYDFLCQKQANNQLADKWLIAKDLPGEVYIGSLHLVMNVKERRHT